MANVYLQVPTYYASYMRNKFDVPLQKGEPLKFSEYSIERQMMRVGLLPISGHKQKSPISFSEYEWKNMMQGRRPEGGAVIRKRDHSEYLSYSEVRDLCGHTLKIKSENYEYLCIQMPTTCVIEGKQCRTNGVYNLDYSTAMNIRNLFQEEFLTRLRIFMICSHHFNFRPTANLKYVREQKIVNTIERFLLCYDIPVSCDYQEFKTIRKMIQRHVPDINNLLTEKEMEHIMYSDSADKMVDIDSSDCKGMLIKMLNNSKKGRKKGNNL